MEKQNFSILLNNNAQKSLDYKFDEPLNKNGFDLIAGWIYYYPVNYSIRKYQYNTVKEALFKNILLCLPTGLGKTFVAAVVIMNYYRWFPNKKIIFIAPTRPLVNQQQQACLSIGGIRAADVACITGTILSNKRLELYGKHKILFMTPQVLQNDIAHGFCNPLDIVCLIIDEAHKASGNHAYCQAIQNVVDNLYINEIIYYHEDHDDVKPFVQNKKIDEIILKFDGPIEELKDEVGEFIIAFLNDLSKNGVLTNPKIGSWSSYRLMMLFDSFKLKKDRYTQDQYKSLSNQLHITHYFVTAFERLTCYGVLAFIRSIFDNNPTNFIKNSALQQLKKKSSLYDKISQLSSNLELSIKQGKKPDFPYHPKINCLIKVLGQHFSDVSNINTRVIVFSQYRDSVDEIISAVSLEGQNIRAMAFVGQSISKHSKGLRQKEQLDVNILFLNQTIMKFRNGDYNVLVSTSVGEEGLDIGEVSLIVFFDVSSSPLRLIQRMGRTGRKNSGKIVVLMMKGVEQTSYNNAKNKSKLMNKALTTKVSKINFSPERRIIPHNIQPFCIHAALSNAAKDKLEASASKKSIGAQSINTNYHPSNKINMHFYKSEIDISVFHILVEMRSIPHHPIRLQCSADLNLPNVIDAALSCNSHSNRHNNTPNVQSSPSQQDIIHLSPQSEIKLKPTKRIILSTESSEAQVSQPCKKSRDFNKNIPKNLGRQMLLTQAEVVDTGSSDTVVTTQDQYIQDSFINDETASTPKVISDQIYKQSLISPDKSGIFFNSRYSRWQDVVKNIENKHADGFYKDSSVTDNTMDETTSNPKIEEEINYSRILTPIIESEFEDNDFQSINSEKSKNKKFSDDLMDLKCSDSSLDSTLTPTTHRASFVEEQKIILIDSNAILSSQIPTYLRMRYGIELLNFTNMPFDFMVGKSIAIDIIKSKGKKEFIIFEIIHEDLKKLFVKYSSCVHIYHKIYIIVQRDNDDELDITPIRIKAIYSLYKACSLETTSIMYSHSQ
ncbi:hypothetical protein HZS_4863, partial [Henneguya salminicola]